jgi:predicted DsbA family dithiol-disulfide isomerase
MQERLLDYSRKAFELFFRREFEAHQPDSVAALIENLGMSADAYRDYLRDAGAVAYDQAQAEAAADNVFSVPLFSSIGSLSGATTEFRFSKNGSLTPVSPLHPTHERLRGQKAIQNQRRAAI